MPHFRSHCTLSVTSSHLRSSFTSRAQLPLVVYLLVTVTGSVAAARFFDIDLGFLSNLEFLALNLGFFRNPCDFLG